MNPIAQSHGGNQVSQRSQRRALTRRPLHLRLHPDPILRQTCAPFEGFGRDAEALAHDMLELMRARQGIGLAGPQIGLGLRVFVAEVGPQQLSVFNPTVLPFGPSERQAEGCLSLPGVSVDVDRTFAAAVSGFDARGKVLELDATALLARVIQHEADHLNGVLIIDLAAAPSPDSPARRGDFSRAAL